MEVTAVENYPNSIHPGRNEDKSGFHSYISGGNEQEAYDSYSHIFHLLKKINWEYYVWYFNSMG